LIDSVHIILANPFPSRTRAMAILPTAQTMTLCDYVIVEERTKKVSVIGRFESIAVDGDFPVRALPFAVVVPLVGGMGDIPVTLTISREEGFELDDLGKYASVLPFRNRFQTLYYVMRMRALEFPAPGRYHFTLSSGDIELARVAVHVYDRRASQ
jgi:hypothetical protein